MALTLAAMLLAGLPTVVVAGAVAAQPEPAYRAEPGDPDGVGLVVEQNRDPRFAAAAARARAELPDFFRRLRSPAPDETSFRVKFDLGEGEFIWADQLRRDDGRLTGRLINTPLNPAFALDQRVEIAEAAISDWGYFRGRVMQGNYTTRVELEFVPPEVAQDFRARFGW